MRAVGIILAGGNNHRMRELSQKRAIAAMPIAGGFRSNRLCTEQHDEFFHPESCSADTVQCKILKRASEFFQMVGFRT